MASLVPIKPIDNALAPKIVHLDPNGNLIIISKQQNKLPPFHFLVSSKILSLSSPVFASLFSDPTSHNKKYQLILDDYPETIGALLEICHFRRSSTLPAVQLRGISSLAEASQKYGISAPLVPWVEYWTRPLHENDRLNFCEGNDLEQWLRVCCVYNQAVLFNKITKRAVLTGSAGSLDISKSPGAAYNNIIAQIALERIDVLAEIIAIALTLLSRYQITGLTCKQPTNSAQCDAILLGSILKGLMALGVYQPTPMAPYPGMTVVALIEKIKNLPLMTDPSHDETCGEVIKGDICKMLKLANEVSDRVKGLELGNFAGNKKVGQVQGLILTVMGGQDTKSEEHGVNRYYGEGKEEEEEGKGKGKGGMKKEGWRGDGGKLEGKSQDEGEVGEGERTEYDDEENNGEGSDEKLVGTVVIDIIEDRAAFSEPTNLQVPAGVITGSHETPEVLKDIRPQILLKEKRATQNVRGMLENGEGARQGEEAREGGEAREEEVEKEQQVEDGEKSSTATKEDCLAGERGVELRSKYIAYSEKKEQVECISKDYTPLMVQGGPPSPSSEKEGMMALQTSYTKHSMSRANAEAHGHTWSAPGPELVQKYQRRPRFPFHPEVTVGDISNEDNTIEIRRLKGLFPQVDTKILVEFLRKGNWNSQDAANMLRAGGIPMNLGNDTGGNPTSVPSFPILEPTILSPLSLAPTIHQESAQGSILPLKAPPSTPSTKTTPNLAPTPKRIISISRLVAGKLSIEQSEARFWPTSDKAVVMRSLALSENKKAIRKLLAMFPQASADKGFIDVLYRSGWDTEKAARRLEGLGLVRQVVSGSGDGEGVKSKRAGSDMG